jgi:septum formation protein
MGILNLNGFRLVLASSSPRRQELLQHLGLPFQVMVPATEEKRRPDEPIRDYVQRNAREKALAVLGQLAANEPVLIIGADTVGLLENQLLEKPVDSADAHRMLQQMSARKHEVLTALAVVSSSGKNHHVLEQLVTTEVCFKSLSTQEIQYYVSTGEPLDKAGSYGIQGIGGFMVEAIKGSYSNVVGLPLVELIELLKKGVQKSDRLGNH